MGPGRIARTAFSALFGLAVFVDSSGSAMAAGLWRLQAETQDAAPQVGGEETTAPEQAPDETQPSEDGTARHPDQADPARPPGCPFRDTPLELIV